jgi:hypothetical protein
MRKAMIATVSLPFKLLENPLIMYLLFFTVLNKGLQFTFRFEIHIQK